MRKLFSDDLEALPTSLAVSKDIVTHRSMASLNRPLTIYLSDSTQSKSRTSITDHYIYLPFPCFPGLSSLFGHHGRHTTVKQSIPYMSNYQINSSPSPEPPTLQVSPANSHLHRLTYGVPIQKPYHFPPSSSIFPTTWALTIQSAFTSLKSGLIRYSPYLCISPIAAIGSHHARHRHSETPFPHTPSHRPAEQSRAEPSRVNASSDTHLTRSYFSFHISVRFLAMFRKKYNTARRVINMAHARMYVVLERLESKAERALGTNTAF